MLAAGTPRRTDEELAISRVSLVATVLNELATVADWLSALESQTRTPDEVVIVDAGSTDGTLELLRAYQGPLALVVLEQLGANVPQGRNHAIDAAAGPLIAVTDAGTVAESRWLEALIEPLERDPGIGVSGGFFRPAGRTWFEYLLATVITPRLCDVDSHTFLPSSRSVAFRKSWWDRAGGYPNWLRAGEDLVFSMRLREAGARVEFVPEAVVRWWPRPTLPGYFRQYRHYARGDGHGHLFFRRHAARYSAYLAGSYLLAKRTRLTMGLLAAGVAGYLRKYLWRVYDERPFGDPIRSVWAFAFVPVIVVTGDIAKMAGFPQGLWERWRSGSAEALEQKGIRSHRVHGDDGAFIRTRRAALPPKGSARRGRTDPQPPLATDRHAQR